MLEACTMKWVQNPNNIRQAQRSQETGINLKNTRFPLYPSEMLATYDQIQTQTNLMRVEQTVIWDEYGEVRT